MIRRLALMLTLAAVPAGATTITGTVTNGTTGRPSAGDQVILIKLAQGMEQEATTVTDASGHYTLSFTDDGPHLVRVIHDKAMYHQPAPPGTTQVDVKVFDAAASMTLHGTVTIIRMQTDSSGLAVTELYAVKNDSSPPKTLFNDHTFEIYLPAGASIDQAMAAGPEGMPVRSAPTPLDNKGHYAFVFPLRPGETKFQISYHLPYSGSASFAPRLTVPMENLAIMLPSSMQFTAADAGKYEQVHDQQQVKGVNIEVARNLAAGAAPAFSISGTGTVPDEALADTGDTSGGGTAGADATAVAANRPGGGLGTPENTPDPLEHYRWYIIAGVGLLLAAGAFWITSRGATPAPATAGASLASASGGRSATSTASATRSGAQPHAGTGGLLLEALKEELFQLETERLQKVITEEEYARAKAALDETLGRAMRRQKS